MNCLESIDFPLDDMHLTSKQRFKANVPSGSFNTKRPGRYPLMFMQHAAEYYRKHLSYPDDALDAMQGIFASFEEQLEKRKVYNVCGIPIFPCRVQGLAVQTALHSFLTGLFWHHVEPGERRAQFPSWSWVGWQQGVISSESFVSQGVNSSKLLPDTTVWFEKSPHLLHNFTDMSLPCDASMQKDVYFIHIETWTMTCTMVCLTPAELPDWEVSSGFFVKFPVDDTTFAYTKLHSSVTGAYLQGSASVEKSKEYLGLILSFASPDFSTYAGWQRASVLVVEQREQYYERVGIFHIGHRYTESRPGMSFVVGPDGKISVLDKLSRQWIEEAPRTKRKIRVG